MLGVSILEVKVNTMGSSINKPKDSNICYTNGWSINNSKCSKYGQMTIYQHIESKKIKSIKGQSMSDFKYWRFDQTSKHGQQCPTW